jgi:hypothetical protein
MTDERRSVSSLARCALAALVITGASVPASASGTIVRLPKQRDSGVTAKLTGLPGASISFFLVTNKHGHLSSVYDPQVHNLPVNCTQGTITATSDGSGAPMPRVSAAGAFSAQLPMAEFGFTGITVTISGSASHNGKKVSGTVSLTENPSPATYYYGTSSPGTEYTNCTVASTPSAWSARVKW